MMQKRHPRGLPGLQMLSISHLIIIFVVALVVFGPEKLPELARNLGKVMGEFRRATGDIRSTFEQHLRDLEREAEQRRIGSSSMSSPPALPDPLPLQAAPGTVPTTPPNIVNAEAPPSEPPPQFASSHETDAPQNAAPADQPPPPEMEKERNAETLTDARLHSD